MGQFDNWKQAELQQACKERGLPATGSNAEMTDRLEQYELLNLEDKGDIEIAVDAPKPVEVDIPAGVVVQAPPPAPQSAPSPPAPPVDPSPAVQAEPAKTAEVLFPCPAELSTGLHQEFVRQAIAQVTAQGHTPKGGDGGAHRTGWRLMNGVRHAVYEVILRRR